MYIILQGVYIFWKSIRSDTVQFFWWFLVSKKVIWKKSLIGGGLELIILNPFLDSLCNFGFKNIGLTPGIPNGCFQHPQDVVTTLFNFFLMLFLCCTTYSFFKFFFNFYKKKLYNICFVFFVLTQHLNIKVVAWRQKYCRWRMQNLLD